MRSIHFLCKREARLFLKYILNVVYFSKMFKNIGHFDQKTKDRVLHADIGRSKRRVFLMLKIDSRQGLMGGIQGSLIMRDERLCLSRWLWLL